MKLTLKINPTKITKSHKPSIYEIFRNGCVISHGSTSNGVSWGYYDKDFAYGLNFQKVRRKVKSTKRVKKVWDGKEVWTNKRTYESGKWIVSYYKIPLTILKFMNCQLKQKSRFFTITNK